MNILLWVLQCLLALHTIMGAVWKLSHSAEQTMPSLKAISQGLWLGLSGLEFLCSLALILPALYRPLAPSVPVAAAILVVEMLLFSGVHLASGASNHSSIVYWLVVALLCCFIAYGRFALRPL